MTILSPLPSPPLPLLAGVMGWPIAHSLSPRIQERWLADCGQVGRYVPLPVRPEHLPTAVRALPALGFRGVNVTLPHKVAVLALADYVSPLARRVGAANLLWVAPDGSLQADNSDVAGFLTPLLRHPAWNPAHPAVVLGAGGAARAVLIALADAGVRQIRLVARNMASAADLCRTLGLDSVSLHPWDQRDAALVDTGLIVNATSLGLGGKTALMLDFSTVLPQALAYDLVYNPVHTAFIIQAKAAGLATLDGLSMLIHQAAPAFERFFGIAAPLSLDQEALLRADLIAALDLAEREA